MKRTETGNRGGRLGLACCVLLLLVPWTMWSQGHKGAMGFRLDGGASWSLGGSFANEGAGNLGVTQPFGRAGVYYMASPQLRVGGEYSYTRMARRQIDGKVNQLAGGGSEATVYRDLTANYHGVAVTCEYNVLGEGPLALYAGTGAGCLIAAGNTYTFGVRNEVKPAGSSVSFTAHNEPQVQAVPYIPVTVSLEYAFLPQTAVSVSCGYRMLMAGKESTAPKGQAYAAVGLRIDLQ
ncbi:MAG: hypothetical protein IKX60_06235 [Bacteroidales bacterium]|nr:hypothetical protein [Bacteroidales bacterium]